MLSLCPSAHYITLSKNQFAKSKNSEFVPFPPILQTLFAMKTFAISAVLALAAAVVHAAPALESRQSQEILTFEGAGPNPPSYTRSVTADGSLFTIDGT